MPTRAKHNYGNAPHMFTQIEWDTAFFGLRIARFAPSRAIGQAEMEAVLADARREGYRLVYFFPEKKQTSVGDWPCAGWLADVKCVYKTRIEQHRARNGADAPRFWGTWTWEQATPSEALYQVALNCGEWSRFRLDARLPRGSYERLYRKWLDASVGGELADVVRCTGLQDHPSGLATLWVKDGLASVGLLGIAETARGQGFGTQLLGALREEAYLRGATQLSVATQRNNEAACRFYERQGFVLVHEQPVYHIWL